MEREIEFRGHIKGTKQWVHGSYFKHEKINLLIEKEKEINYVHLIITDGMSDWNLPTPIKAIEVNGESVGQYTGVHDEIGKRIYERDIVKFRDAFSKNDFIGVVKYYAGIKPIIENSSKHSVDLAECNEEDLEVMGNLDDNPNFLAILQ